VSGPVRHRFIFPQGGLGAHLRVPVSPADEVLSSPRMPLPDNETIAGIFPGKVIIVDSGKVASIIHFSLPPKFFWPDGPFLLSEEV